MDGKPLIISTPHKAIQHLNKIRSEFEQIKANKLAHEQRKAQPPQLSLVDHMNARGMNSNFTVRSELAKQFGMKEYHGTTAHNARLLAILQGQNTTQNNG